MGVPHPPSMSFGGTMAIDDKVRNFSRVTFGSLLDKSVCKVSFGHTETNKLVAAASDTAVHAAITMTSSAQTITTSITDPDVPRVLKVQPGGTAADVGNGLMTITGTNVEGKIITDTFQLVDGDTTEIDGKMAFKTVTSISVPACEGTGATVSVGYTNKLGLYHRLFPDNTTVKVVYRSAAYGTPTLDTTPSIGDADEQYIEKNFITPATAPDAAKIYDIFYIYDNWTVGEVTFDESLTSTSTSSTSTSTTTSYTTTSTSSTSSSTSSTSSSTSSTSSSTSSTSSSTSSTSSSTSTTTVP